MMSVTPEALVGLCEEIQTRPKRVTWVYMPFGDGTYRFMLGRKQIAELERTCGYQGRDGAVVPLGIGAIFSRMAKGRAFLPTGEVAWDHISEAEVLASEIVERDAIEVIRLGLVGGAEGVVNDEAVPVNAARAGQLVDTYVVGQPLEDAWHFAFAVLAAAIYGIDAVDAAPPSEGV